MTGMADEIDTLLDAYHSNTLWDMANAAGLPVTDAKGKKLSKSQVIAQMRARFFARERVLASLARLNDRERAVLDRLLLRGGTAPTRTLQREVLRARLVTVAGEGKPRNRTSAGVPYAEGYAGDPSRIHSKEFADVVARLTYQGLVFSRTMSASTGGASLKLQFHPGDTLFVPEAIRRHLPQPKSILVEVRHWQPDEVQPGDPALVLRDLYLYWDFVRRNAVPLLQSGLVGKRSLRAINSVLLVPDPLLEDATREDEAGQLWLLRTLLEGVSLLQNRQGQLRPAGEDPLVIPPFWAWPVSRQLQACLEAWSRLLATARLDVHVAQYGPRFPHAWKVLLDSLRSDATDAWIDLEELFELVQDRDLDFLFGDHTKVESYRGSYYYGKSPAHFNGAPKELLKRFEQAERRFVEGMVTGFLHQLGITDLGRVGGKWGAIRLTPIGRTLLAGDQAQASAPVAAEAGKLIVQPNFQVLVIGPVNLEWLARMDLFAERVRADRGAFEYHLSRDSIYRAQQVGMGVDQVLHFLERAGGIELPQNVRRSLEEWGAHHERIVFRSGVSLLQAAGEDLLSALISDSQTGEHLARAVSPEVALLKKGCEGSLIDGLVGQGLFPAVSGAGPETADRSVVIHEDGSIRPIHAVPSLHLRGRLSRLAEEGGDGTWRLTEKSVRHAGGSKGKVLRLLEELGRLHRGSVPESVREKVKAWGDYYGNAAAGTVTLIEFRDQETLEELRQHPDLKPYLTPFSAGSRALAAVAGDRLAEVQEILARFGVSVRSGL